LPGGQLAAAHNAPEQHGLLVQAAAEQQRNTYSTLPPQKLPTWRPSAPVQLPHQTPLPLPVRPHGGGGNPELTVAAALPVSASINARHTPAELLFLRLRPPRLSPDAIGSAAAVPFPARGRRHGDDPNPAAASGGLKLLLPPQDARQGGK